MLKQVPPPLFWIQQKELPQQRGRRKHLFNINNISTVQTALLEGVASRQRYKTTCPRNPGACPGGRGKSHPGHLYGLVMSSHQTLWLWLWYSASTDDMNLCWPLRQSPARWSKVTMCTTQSTQTAFWSQGVHAVMVLALHLHSEEPRSTKKLLRSLSKSLYM